MSDFNSLSLLSLAIALVVTIGLFHMTIAAVKDFSHSDQAEKIESWCHGSGGEIEMVHSFSHGGLHCVYANGTVAHPPDRVYNGSR